MWLPMLSSETLALDVDWETSAEELVDCWFAATPCSYSFANTAQIKYIRYRTVIFKVTNTNC